MLEILVTEGLALEKFGDIVKSALEAGESLLDAVEGVAEQGFRWFFEHEDSVAELAGLLGELAGKAAEIFGEYGGAVGELIAAGLEQVQKGAEWMQEHPDVVVAALKLVALVSFGVAAPELLGEIILTQPGAIESILDSCKPLIEALG